MLKDQLFIFNIQNSTSFNAVYFMLKRDLFFIFLSFLILFYIFDFYSRSINFGSITIERGVFSLPRITSSKKETVISADFIISNSK